MIIDKLEQSLRPPETPMVPYPPKYITLASGEKMVVHQISREDVPRVLEAVKPMIAVEKDFYDIVAARLYAELLGYYRYRVKDEYCLVGTINGVIAGIVNGRMLNEKVGMSYHTITLKRGLRIGAQLFAAKMEYHLDYLGQEEVWIVAESPIGFRRWMIEYELEPRPEQWHELGGVPTYVLTRALWEKHKAAKCTGRRPVPEEMLATAKKLIVPSM
ncbi:Acyl-CoA N-acyltransferase [Moorella glycerini]|uniref:N-acetyltransferase domain-containing protein n=1 Tax=Neomoorella stamsii TaxID=1266720 RepID=A0A9X7P6K5_9FIRM|nr:MULTISPECIES: hypothetical protein [Moorella]PRR73405.1 hypothetical protein MOST_12530 [Moorella stamsii]CEP69174.1 Acyl-CoA N-acyltransferase [Moorella glycerini]